MTSLALDSANILHSYAVHFASFEIVMEFFINAVKFISGAVIIIEIDICRAMAIDAPPHA